MGNAEVAQFLQTLWPHGFEGRWLLLWGAPSKRSEWVALITEDTLSRIDAWAAQENVYVGCALREQAFGPSARGTRGDCAAIPGLWLDVDYGSEHKKPTLPATEAEARRLIEAMGIQPTMIVHSGRGLQAWWCFKEPWILESEGERAKAEQLTQGWSTTLRAHAKANGWDQDQVGDLPRVMRLPGTWNRKGVPVRTKLLSCDPEVRHNPSEFERFVMETPAARAVADITWKIEKSPTAEPPSHKFFLLCEHDQEFKRLCLRMPAPTQTDHSASGFDYQLARRAFAAQWSAQEVTNLLIAQRRAHRADLKLSHSCYYEKTLSSAFHGTPEAAREQLVEGLKAGKELPAEVAKDPAEILAVLSGLLGVTITKFLRYRSDENTYQLVVNEKTIDVPTIQTFDSQTLFRRTVLDHTGHRIPVLKAELWGEVVVHLFAAVEEVEVKHADQLTIFKQRIEEYLYTGVHTDSDRWADACLTGRPFTLQGAVHLPASGLLTFLTTTSTHEKLTSKELSRILTKLGYDSVKKDVKVKDGRWTSRICWIAKD